MLRPLPAAEKNPWGLDRIAGFGSGARLSVTHPPATPALREITRRGNENDVGAEPDRMSDLAALMARVLPSTLTPHDVEQIPAIRT